MPRSTKVTVTYLTYDENGENEQEWEVSCSVYPGSPGTWNDPPDGGEVCVLTATSSGITLTCDEFFDQCGLDDKDYDAISEKAFEACDDELADAMCSAADDAYEARRERQMYGDD